jgi:hypothetical protein
MTSLQRLQRDPSRDLHIVAIANVIGGVIVLAVCNAVALFRLFDASPYLASASSFRGPLLRWDALHFEHVAEQGYIFEHEWAFFPAIAWVIRMTAWVSQQTRQSAHWNSSLIFCLVTLIVADASRVLYKLTLHYMKSISVARVASAMFLLSSSPATLRMAPYTEAFFTWLSYRGKKFIVVGHLVSDLPRTVLYLIARMAKGHDILYACGVFPLKRNMSNWFYSLGTCVPAAHFK